MAYAAFYGRDAAMAEKRKKKEEEKLGWQKSVLLYAHDMLYLLLIVMLLFLLVFRIIVVSGGSMRMTLLDGDYLLLLNNTFYHTPQWGDIVVISKESFDNGKPIVKRVIATEGQTVDIDFETGEVSVDGTVLQEDYINALTTVDGGVHFPLTVAEGCIFVLGHFQGQPLPRRGTDRQAGSAGQGDFPDVSRHGRWDVPQRI